ncbi:MAG TPA: hypothetical protein DF383_06675 [Deltaproteobacteria bacterium]|nr:hypothetical protein [Deltaproteobacteria bacterium]
MAKLMRRFVLYWVLFGVAIALTQRVQGEYLWILALFPVGIWALIGCGIFAAVAWGARHRSGRALALRNAAVLVVGGALFLPLASLGDYITEKVRFSWKRSSYERVVSWVSHQPLQNGRSADGPVKYILDPGPPPRVAFPWPGGTIDNWCGVVHDPSGEVLSVNDFALWSDQWRGARVTKLFGGDMISCRLLEASYYFCCFT